MAPLQDAGPLDDPVGVKTEAAEEMIVGDNGVGNIMARPHDADAHQASAARAEGGGPFFIHEFRATRIRTR